MAIRPRAGNGAAPVPSNSRPAPRPAPKAAAVVEEIELSPGTGVVHHEFGVSVSRSFTLKVGDHFMKFGVTMNAPTYEDASAAVSERMMQEAEAAKEQFDNLSTMAGEVSAAPAGEEAELGGEPAAETATVGPDDIRAMSRKELMELIIENSIDVNPDDFKANKTGLDEMREAVVAAAYPEGEPEAAEGEEVPEPGADEPPAVSEEDVLAMNRAELVQFIDNNGLEINYKAIKELKKLQAAVVAVLPELTGEGGELEPDADKPYTREDLSAMSVDDLKAVYSEWKIDGGKFPSGPPIQAKKTAISRILQSQETGV